MKTPKQKQQAECQFDEVTLDPSKQGKSISLPSSEFEILADEEHRVVLYDRIVDKCYTWTRKPPLWHFPKGSRVEIIAQLTGINLRGTAPPSLWKEFCSTSRQLEIADLDGPTWRRPIFPW